MRWFLLALFSLVLPDLSNSQIILNEVYYDPPGTDEGYEFVELISLADASLSLGGYVIEFHDGASEGWVRIWEGNYADTILRGGLFVVGGERVVPPADAIDDLGMQNGPDAVRLVRGAVEVDLVGYGSLDDPRYYEGNPAPDVVSGWSVARSFDGVDTGDNAADFERAEPSPGRFNVARRDVALRRAARTPGSEACERTCVEVFVFYVVDRGVEPIEAGAVTVELADSTEMGTPLVVSRDIPGTIVAGDSAAVEFEIELAEGYHRVYACAVYTGDERAENDTTRMFRRVGRSPVLVSEVMSHPKPGCPEYVELFNAGWTPYELTGHWIRDDSHEPQMIASTPRAIPPGGFIVLTPDSGGLMACFTSLRSDAVLEIEGQWPSLNQTGSGKEADSVIVLDPSFVPVDRVAYPPQPSATGGRSLERVDLFSGAGPHTWVLCGADAGGSPGERSPNSRSAPPEGERVTVSPNPFDPLRQEGLIAVIPRRKETERVVVAVFDLNGYRVVDLGSTAVLPSTFIWDGANAEGRTVPPGIYILACEFFSLTTGSRRVEKVVVGCGRKNDPGASR